MGLQIEKEDGIVVLRGVGKLAKEDYSKLTAEFEQRPGAEKLRVLFDITAFEGWEAGGFWEEIKFDLHHNSDIGRLAVVGDAQWKAVLVAALKPFAVAETRYFEALKMAEARRWLRE